MTDIWSVITAIGTAASAIIIASTAIFALAQLRELHRASQFDVTRKMIDEIKNPLFFKAWLQVAKDFPQRTNDAAFQAEMASTRPWEVDYEQHPEVLILAYLEEVGIYVKQRLIDEEALLAFNQGLILQAWERLGGVVELTRRTQQDPNAWYYTEFLVNYTKQRQSRRAGQS